MKTLNEQLKEIQLNHDESSLQSCFNISDDKVDEFGRTMAEIGSKIPDMQVTEIIEHVLTNSEINTLQELICTMFIAGMGTAESKHREGLESMRQDVLDMAINAKSRNGDPVKPEDFIERDKIIDAMNRSDGKEF